MALVAEKVPGPGLEELVLFRDAVETGTPNAPQQSGGLKIDAYKEKLENLRMNRAPVPFMNPTAGHAAVLNSLLLTSAHEARNAYVGIVSTELRDDIWKSSCDRLKSLRESGAMVRVVLMKDPKDLFQSSAFAKALAKAKSEGLDAKAIHWPIKDPNALQHMTIVNDDQYRFEVIRGHAENVGDSNRDFVPARGSFNGPVVGAFLRKRFEEIWQRAVARAERPDVQPKDGSGSHVADWEVLAKGSEMTVSSG